MHLARASPVLWVRGVGIAAMFAVASSLAGGCFAPNTCSTDTDCRKDQICSGTSCKHIECRSDSECGRKQICTVLFECRVGCRFDDECPPGSTCVDDDSGNRRCQPSCNA